MTQKTRVRKEKRVRPYSVIYMDMDVYQEV